MSTISFGRNFKKCNTPTNQSPSSSKYSTPVAGPSPVLSRRASLTIGRNLFDEQCTSRAAMNFSLAAKALQLLLIHSLGAKDFVEFRVNEKRNRDGGKAVSTEEQERKRQRSCATDHVSETASNSSGPFTFRRMFLRTVTSLYNRFSHLVVSAPGVLALLKTCFNNKKIFDAVVKYMNEVAAPAITRQILQGKLKDQLQPFAQFFIDRVRRGERLHV